MNNILDKLATLTQQWNNRLAVNNLRLSERYLVGEVEFLIHLRFRPSAHSSNFCAIVRYDEAVWSNRRYRNWRLGEVAINHCAERGVNFQNGVSEAEPELSKSAGHHQQESVLVEVINIVKHPEYLESRLVRLFRPNEVYSRRAHALYFSRERGFISGWRLIEWEVGFSVGGSAVCLDQLPCEIVKSAAQVVCDLASDNGDCGRQRGADANPECPLLRLRVIITPECVWVGVPKGYDFPFEIVDVVFGPFDFRPYVGESC